MAKKEITPFPEGMDDAIQQTIALILANKEQERALAESRREMESWLVQVIGADPTLDKTSTYGNSKVKITFKPSISTKVDADKIKEIAEKENRPELLKILFRWKAELNKTEWNLVSDETKKLFVSAMETKANKPQLEYTYIEEK